MNTMQTEINKNRDFMKILESRIELLQQGARAKPSTYLRNISKLEEENKQMLRETVMKIGTLIDYNV